MFTGIGTGEILLIMIVGLLFLKPEQLAKLLVSIKQTTTNINKKINEFSSEVEIELQDQQRIKHLQAAEKDPHQQNPELQESLQELARLTQEVQNPYKDDASKYN